MTHTDHDQPLTDTPPLLLLAHGGPRLGKSSPLWWTAIPADQAVTNATTDAERPESPRC